MSQVQETFENIKNKIYEIFEKIKETEAYQQLSDRYETLTPNGQKIVQALSTIFILFVILFIPLSQISTSKEFVTGFEDKRNLIRDLFKTYRDSSASSQLAPAPDSNFFIGSINSTLQAEQLLPEQIISVGLGASEGRLIPQNLMTSVIDVKLSKLNLRQVVDIGSRLAGLSQAVKLKDFLMTANAELVGYFDVTYKLYSLNVPPPPLELPPEPETKSSKKKKQTDKQTDTESSNTESKKNNDSSKGDE